MRLMNFDVPYIQDLANTRRFPHSIGTCYLAYKTVERSALSSNKKKLVIAAALIHDIGILPYGHLLESIIKFNFSNSFSHEKLVQSILTGTYHATNIYHQILASESLRISKVLKQHHISITEIFDLICPKKGKSSAISADVDLDNLDNVHRMASLLGYGFAKKNLEDISAGISIDQNLGLVFSSNLVDPINHWLEMRRKIYTMIIAHPECVAYNSFLSQLLHKAVLNNVVGENEWYLTDQLLEQRLLKNKKTKPLAKWLFTRPQFELVDYVWLVSSDRPNIPLQEIEKIIINQPFSKPKKSDYFFWSENKLISREVLITLNNQEKKRVGSSSSSILISLISKTDYGLEVNKIPMERKQKWRREVISFVQKTIPDWRFEIKFPENYDGDFFSIKLNNEQLKLFK